MSQTNIYFGFWTNFNRGTVLGSTLTLTSRDGVLFIAFLALFVRLAGSRLWNIFRYIAHQLRSKSGPQDGLYHQQQALLRNQSSNTDILWGLTQLGWAWKSKARGGIFRQLPLALLALIHIITLTLAGLFSSRVATASTSETLLASDSDCGFLKFPTKYNWSAFDAETLNHYSAVQLERKHGYQESSTYVKACYGKPESSSSLSCSNYVRNAITPSIQYNTTCPFTDNFCTYGHSSSITLDSGMVDSLSHLGLNTAPNNRLGYRTQLICAPLNTENYHTAWAPSTTTVFPGDRMRYYYYGPTLGTVFGEQLNATFAVSNYSISLTNRAYKLA